MTHYSKYQNYGFSGSSGAIGEPGFSGSSGAIGFSKDWFPNSVSGLTYQSYLPILEIDEILPYGEKAIKNISPKNWMDKFNNTIQLYE